MTNYSVVDIDTLEKPPEDFKKLLKDSPFGTLEEGSITRGTIIAIEIDYVTIDVGLKSEGKVPLKEFGAATITSELKVGDFIDVYVVHMDSANGQIELSREKARREAAWLEIEASHVKGEKVVGTIFSRVKGGFTVDLQGAIAFLPGSQVDVRPVKDFSPLMNKEQPFLVLKMDLERGNIVVSRRAVLEESQAEVRDELLSKIDKGAVLSGTVKNITDYGAFVDLGGFDGLLHVTDISWKRIQHPSDILSVGQTIKVQVVKYNKDNNRISLGMKQLEEDPWNNVDDKFAVRTLHKGKITNITDYGAFVELLPGIEGLVHVSEISWVKKNLHPNKMLTIGQEVDLMVLEFEKTKRRIALGIKQCLPSPWTELTKKMPVGTVFEGKITNVKDFGVFVQITDDVDGLVHMSDLSADVPGEKVLKELKK